MENTRFKISQYACAVLLIVSSIALVAYQVIHIDDVALPATSSGSGITNNKSPAPSEGKKRGNG